jgi:hypothetical protein
MLSDANTKSVKGELSSHHVPRAFKVFRDIPCIVTDLSKPYLLHTMQIGIRDHLHNWIFNFMKKYERLDKYNAIWLSVPASHYLTPKHKSQEEDSQ